MKASQKHDAMMILGGVAVGMVAMWLLAKYQPTLVGIGGYAPYGRATGFSQAGSVCPTCTTMAF